ncbi:HNH endonuclease domain-containing protein [Bacillus sp. UNCCL81]|uniref:HNH endonuclease domain-containing protein n=1 Tax=Bacillus sp. UNCCL81 TaxID=1502755 RepID=UPI0008E386B3|nr:HNH endonuclease domain-containing protein [Bacillus sp. UNCCL81]SFC42162.1 HNH endonuclease [Bacillus sp. UNCCL81]
MRKINLSDKAILMHEQYFENNILVEIKNEYQNSSYHPSLSEIRALKKKVEPKWEETKIRKKLVRQHILFLRYVENRYKIFATGKKTDLKELNEFIKENFHLVYHLIRIDVKNQKGNNYSNHLNKIFCYEKFKVKDFFYYIKKLAIRNLKLDQNSRYSHKIQDEIVNILVTNYPNHTKEIFSKLGKGELYASECEKNFRELTKLNITMDNFKQLDIFQKEWNDYHFILESSIRVCPYCNRQYITPILSDNGKMRADIDHFLPKNEYPYFSMSIYNLVPVCKPCNQSLKGDRNFTFDNISPYDDNISDYFKFEANLSTYEVSTVVSKGQDAIYRHLDIFKIEALYNYHQNHVEELVKKRIAYPDKYIQDLYEKNKDYFNNELEVKQIIVGYIHDINRLNDEAFLKFRLDLAQQLGFLETCGQDRIDRLKELIKVT